MVNLLAVIMGLVGVLIIIISIQGDRKIYQKLDQIDPTFFPNWMVLLIIVALEMVMIGFLVLFLIG